MSPLFGHSDDAPAETPPDSEPSVPAPDDYLPVVTRLPEALAEEQAERDAAELEARIAQLVDEGQEPAEAERLARGLPEVAPEPELAPEPEPEPEIEPEPNV